MSRLAFAGLNSQFRRKCVLFRRPDRPTLRRCRNAKRPDAPLVLVLSDKINGRLGSSGGLVLRPSTGYRARSHYVIEHCVLVFDEEPPVKGRAEPDPRVVVLGDDSNGVALEIIGIELEDGGFLVIHVMPLRKRYREQYEEAKKCRE